MATTTIRTAALATLGCLAAAAVVVGGASCASGTTVNQGVPDGGDSGNAHDTSTPVDRTTPKDSPSTVDVPIVPPGCDADLNTDPRNCGFCNNPCTAGDTCSCGMCTPPCSGGLTPCCGSCIDTTMDPNNCGMCQNECLPSPSGIGTPVCEHSQCSYVCPLDASAPDGGGKIIQCGPDSGAAGCYDPTSSAFACGGCGKQCGNDQVCIDSMCCASGSAVCGGQCENVQDSSTSCGACDAACPAPATCTAGVCSGYSVSHPTLEFLDACNIAGHTSILANQTEWAAAPAMTLPINFSFFGTAVTNVWLQSQGAIGIGTPPGFPPPDSFLQCGSGGPDPADIYSQIVAFGDPDLETLADGVCYAEIGAQGAAGDAGSLDAGHADATADAGAGHRFVVTWSNTTDFSDPGSVMTFSLVLTEGTNTIDFMYGKMSGADGGVDMIVGGSTSTVGLLRITGGTATTAVSCDQAFIPSTPYDVRLTPL